MYLYIQQESISYHYPRLHELLSSRQRLTCCIVTHQNFETSRIATLPYYLLSQSKQLKSHSFSHCRLVRYCLDSGTPLSRVSFFLTYREPPTQLANHNARGRDTSYTDRYVQCNNPIKRAHQAMCFASIQRSGCAACRLHFCNCLGLTWRLLQDTSQVMPSQSLTVSEHNIDICNKATVATAKAKIQVREPRNLVRIDFLMDAPLYQLSSPFASSHADILTIAGGSYYVITKSLSAKVYQDLVDRGWRR